MYHLLWHQPIQLGIPYASLLQPVGLSNQQLTKNKNKNKNQAQHLGSFGLKLESYPNGHNMFAVFSYPAM
jgi:hypothetical protein